MGIFLDIFEDNTPRLFNHFNNIELRCDFYLVEWTMTIFSKNLNIDIVSRIWDLYMIEGIKAIYQAAIAIFFLYEVKLLNSNFEDCLMFLQGITNEKLEENDLIEKMKEVKFSDYILFEIQKLNDEFLQTY